MIVDPEKFQSRSRNSDAHAIEIDDNKIETTNSVDLFGIHIDNKLTFDDYIFTLCNKCECNRSIEMLFRQKELEVILNSFTIYSNFNYCPLVWHFSSCKALRKIENIHKRCYNL